MGVEEGNPWCPVGEKCQDGTEREPKAGRDEGDAGARHLLQLQLKGSVTHLHLGVASLPTSCADWRSG